MSRKAKIIYLSFTIIVPFIIYCVIYYTPIIRNAPYRAAEFVSVEVKWGLGEDLVNSYNSATGDYQYLDPKDSLIQTNVKLRPDDMMYLHGKASELGFWNLPDTIANYGTNFKKNNALRYFMKMNYKRKSKTVVYLTDYNEVPKLKDVADQMQKLMVKTVNDAEDRYGNPNKTKD